jgi:hypothetical protein
VELVRQKTYRKTFELACDRLRESALEDRAARAGLTLTRRGDGCDISVPFFDDTIEIAIPDFSFRSASGSNVTLTTKIVLLHYLIHASGDAVGTALVPYEDIPGCRSYLPVFERRVVAPLLRAFGASRDAFVAAGAALGGREEEYGNGSFTLSPFPRLPLTFILWEGDEDFPPSIKVLFDRSIPTYLPLEDVVVVSKMAATRILAAAKKACGEP